MLVHFPVAAWTVATALALLSLVDGFSEWALPAQYANAFGLLTGVVAMSAGMFELMALPQDAGLRKSIARHATFAFTAWLVYGIAWIFQVKQLPWPAAASCVIGFVLLALAGHAGGRIVYHHGFPAHDSPANNGSS